MLSYMDKNVVSKSSLAELLGIDEDTLGTWLKGSTSYNLRDIYPVLKSRLPCMWTRSYYAGTVGHVSEETVKKYIENQKSK